MNINPLLGGVDNEKVLRTILRARTHCTHSIRRVLLRAEAVAVDVLLRTVPGEFLLSRGHLAAAFAAAVPRGGDLHFADALLQLLALLVHVLLRARQTSFFLTARQLVGRIVAYSCKAT